MNETKPRHCVASVGLGAMGRPIAQHLVQAGFDVLTYDADASVRVPGATAVDALTELSPADVIVVIVPTDADVVAVVSELFGTCRPGTVIVISASVHPNTCVDLARRGAERGIDVIDAALTGGVRGAENGELNLLVGGDPSIVERVGDVFAGFARSYHVLGGVGAGQVGKSANNLIHWAQIVAIDESLRLAQRLGVSVPTLRSALQDGPTDSRTLRELEFMRFTWYVKDIEIAQRLAAEAGFELPQAATSRELMDRITVESTHALLGLPS